MKEKQSSSWSLGELEYLSDCPFCNTSLSNAEVFSRQDDTLSLSDIWHMHKCSSCRCIYLNPRPNAVSLPNAYKNYYTHQIATDSKELLDQSFITRLINGYLNYRFSMSRPNASKLGAWFFNAHPPLRMKLDFYGRHIPKQLCKPETKLLDVGCGDGSFLLKAREMGITVYGLETDSSSKENYNKINLDVHIGDLQSANFEKNSFDYITLNHVIEHVQNPNDLLKDLYSLLKDDGTLWLGLPNSCALGITRFGKAWKGFHPPFHLLIPSQKMLKKMLLEAGFENIQFMHRGMQSAGMWQESQHIALRENLHKNSFISKLFLIFSHFISSFSTKWGEETIVIAKRSGRNFNA